MTTDFKSALDMPNFVGTPDTSAYKRSSENVIRWYGHNYATIRLALKLADRIPPDMRDQLLKECGE
jgi:hypothetical protein